MPTSAGATLEADLWDSDLNQSLGKIASDVSVNNCYFKANVMKTKGFNFIRTLKEIKKALPHGSSSASKDDFLGCVSIPVNDFPASVLLACAFAFAR